MKEVGAKAFHDILNIVSLNGKADVLAVKDGIVSEVLDMGTYFLYADLSKAKDWFSEFTIEGVGNFLKLLLTVLTMDVNAKVILKESAFIVKGKHIKYTVPLVDSSVNCIYAPDGMNAVKKMLKKDVTKINKELLKIFSPFDSKKLFLSLYKDVLFMKDEKISSVYSFSGKSDKETLKKKNDVYYYKAELIESAILFFGEADIFASSDKKENPFVVVGEKDDIKVYLAVGPYIDS